MTVDRWKPVQIEKKPVRNIFTLLKNETKKENKKKNDYKTVCITPLKIKSLFTINTTWQITSEKLLKNSSSFTSRTAFIHQNAPFWNITKCCNLKMKTMYCNDEINQCNPL